MLEERHLIKEQLPSKLNVFVLAVSGLQRLDILTCSELSSHHIWWTLSAVGPNICLICSQSSFCPHASSRPSACQSLAFGAANAAVYACSWCSCLCAWLSVLLVVCSCVWLFSASGARLQLISVLFALSGNTLFLCVCVCLYAWLVGWFNVRGSYRCVFVVITLLILSACVCFMIICHQWVKLSEFLLTSINIIYVLISTCSLLPRIWCKSQAGVNSLSSVLPQGSWTSCNSIHKFCILVLVVYVNVQFRDYETSMLAMSLKLCDRRKATVRLCISISDAPPHSGNCNIVIAKQTLGPFVACWTVSWVASLIQELCVICIACYVCWSPCCLRRMDMVVIQ